MEKTSRFIPYIYVIAVSIAFAWLSGKTGFLWSPWYVLAVLLQVLALPALWNKNVSRYLTERYPASCEACVVAMWGEVLSYSHFEEKVSVKLICWGVRKGHFTDGDETVYRIMRHYHYCNIWHGLLWTTMVPAILRNLFML